MTDEAVVLEPLVVEFEVSASAQHAFSTWVEQAALWWPKGHTMSGAPAAVVFEPQVGGRIYERGEDGAEHPWGEVLVWDPPGRVEYLWHLFFPRAEATQVAVTFTPVRGDGATIVRLEQTGWDALGEQGPIRRSQTTTGWAATSAAFRQFIEGARP